MLDCMLLKFFFLWFMDLNINIIPDTEKLEMVFKYKK